MPISQNGLLTKKNTLKILIEWVEAELPLIWYLSFEGLRIVGKLKAGREAHSPQLIGIRSEFVSYVLNLT